MIEVDHKKFSDLEKAIRDCVATASDMRGLKISHAIKDYDTNAVQNAAVMALMSLTGSWVRPNSVKFVTGAASEERTF